MRETFTFPQTRFQVTIHFSSFSFQREILAMIHVQDIQHLGSVESTLRQSVTLGMLADADLATDLATTLANIATRNAGVLAGLRPDRLSLYHALVAAIKLGFNLLGATTMITDTATIYAAIEAPHPPADVGAIGSAWQPGFAVTL